MHEIKNINSKHHSCPMGTISEIIYDMLQISPLIHPELISILVRDSSPMGTIQELWWI